MAAAFSAIAIALAAAACGGMVFHLAAALQVRRFAKAPRTPPAARPPVSVLKPLCGGDLELTDNLLSHCRQDYDGYQLVFGVRDGADPALEAVRRLSAECPETDVAVVVDPNVRGRNLKVSNLLNMLPAARHDVLAIADSDVRVDEHYLDDVVAPFADPRVGLVTCLYVGRPRGGVWSRLGALGINHGFLPSALVARRLGRADGCFGATMALRRGTLDEIGGLEPLRDLLADDWGLGAAVRRAGGTIALAARPVDIVVDEPDFATLAAHEIRWGRTIAAVDRASYLASVVTQPVALALLAALAGRFADPYLLLLLAATCCRLWAVRSEEKALSLPRAGLGLLALREALTFAVFVVACCGRSVTWRGHRFRIQGDGTLTLVEGIAP
jgi:ceramide glucosyltransferase